jgi:Helix-turn-helix domain
LDSIHSTAPDDTGKNVLDVKQPDVSAAFTVDEAHAQIGKDKISRGAFYAAINRGEVPHIRLGHRILIPRHSFLRFLNGGE